MSVGIFIIMHANGGMSQNCNKWVKTFDPDAFNGRGFLTVTNDQQKAKKFATFKDAMDFWKIQSKVRPFRPDGKPNRPLTAYTIEVKDI